MEETRVCAVQTQIYEADIGRLIKKRLSSLQAYNKLVKADKSSALMKVACREDERIWIKAVASLIHRDIACLELAERVNALPLTVSEKKWILRKAMQLSKSGSELLIEEGLESFYKDEDRLNLEGFVRFRLPEMRESWESCIRQATEELLLKSEYMKLVGVLAKFVHMQKPRVKNIYLVLHPDGGCTLTDDKNVRVNYASCNEEGIISVLIGLSPEHITVYDLSGGRAETLADVLLRVFDDRVKYFK